MNVTHNLNRRSFLKLGLAGAAAATWPARLAALADAPKQSPATQQSRRPARAMAVHARLRGPLSSLAVPFTEDDAVDYDSLRRWVEFQCERKAPVIFFTFGDGEIDMLSEEEIGKINLTATEQAKGRLLVVGATGPWWTGRTVDFVKRMEDGGVEAINVHFSHRIRDDKQLFPAFEQIASKTTVPLLVYDDDGMTTATMLHLAEIPQVIGVKSHGTLYAFYDQARRSRDNAFAVLGAGQMKQFLFGGPLGSPGYLCPLAPAAPEISQRFYQAVIDGKTNAAQQIVFDYEDPLLKATIPLGYPQAYKSMLHLAGHYRTNRVRPPRISNPVDQLADLKGFLKRAGAIA
jgi:4-hydroxy-tetrahydrodipicolinate synthase